MIQPPTIGPVAKRAGIPISQNVMGIKTISRIINLTRRYHFAGVRRVRKGS